VLTETSATPRTNLGLAVLVVVSVALVAGCGGSSKSAKSNPTCSTSAPSSASEAMTSYDNGSSSRGGTYRVGWEQSFGFTDNLDPTGEYLGNAINVLENLLLRPLIGYRHQAGPAGNQLVGDLAIAVPKPTDNGLTYTYTLRRGVRFGDLEGCCLRARSARRPE
jgi:peptide/nickel transport system substrate-binding protein